MTSLLPYATFLRGLEAGHPYIRFILLLGTGAILLLLGVLGVGNLRALVGILWRRRGFAGGNAESDAAEAVPGEKPKTMEHLLGGCSARSSVLVGLPVGLLGAFLVTWGYTKTGYAFLMAAIPAVGTALLQPIARRYPRAALGGLVVIALATMWAWRGIAAA